jgi:hypothetical protein
MVVLRLEENEGILLRRLRWGRGGECSEYDYDMSIGIFSLPETKKYVECELVRRCAGMAFVMENMSGRIMSDYIFWRDNFEEN